MKSVTKAVALTIFATAIQLHAALTVHTDFESGSAKVLELNPEAQSIRISSAGDPKRGLPNWWYLRMDGVDTNKPVVLDVVALSVSMPGQWNWQAIKSELDIAHLRRCFR